MEKTLVESLMALSNRGFLDAGKSIAEFVRWSFWKRNQKLQLVCTIWQNLSRSLFSFSIILLKILHQLSKFMSAFLSSYFIEIVPDEITHFSRKICHSQISQKCGRYVSESKL